MNARDTPPGRIRERGRACQGGVLAKLLVFLVVVFAFVALAWMIFLPTVVTTQLRQRSGFDGKVERLAVNPFSGKITLHGLVVTNPPTFPVRDFLELRGFQATTRVRSLFDDQTVFDHMMIDVASVTLVKRADGATNAEVFEANLKGSPGGATLVAGNPTTRKVLVRQLDLQIDRLVIEDHSLRQPSRREYTLNLRQSYTDVTQLEDLLAPAALKGLAPVAAAISGLLPGAMGEALKQAGSLGTESLREAGRKAGERVKGFFDALEESKKP